MKKINKRELPIIFFLFIWLFVMLGLIVLPVTPRFGNIIAIISLNALFVSVVSAVAICWVHRVQKLIFFPIQLKPMNRNKFIFIWNFSFVSSFLGLIFIMFDRIFIRGIDYSKGFRNARYQWLSLGVAGSIFGKLGNLMIPFSYCLLFICIFHWELMESRKRILGLTTALAVQVGFAMLNGGRSNILVAIIFMFVCCIMSREQGKPFFPPLKMKLTLSVVGSYFLFQYCMSIFYAFTDNSVYYLSQSIYYLGGAMENWYYKYATPLGNSIIHIFMYLFHGSLYSGAVLCNVPSHVSINQNISFRGLWNILARLNLINYQMQLPDFDSGTGAFVAVPGILLYDYGYLGFALGSVLLGIMLGVAINEIANYKKNMGIIRLAFCFIIMIHIYLSPVTMALGLGYFIFMIFALIAMEVIAAFLYGFSSWTTVSFR